MTGLITTNDYKAVADLNRIFKDFRKTLKNAFKKE